MTAAVRRDTASEAIAAIHRKVYHQGHPAGASHTTGAMTATTTASSGATSGFSPRERPSAALPAAAPASITDSAASIIGTSQLVQSVSLAPYGGLRMPRHMSRRR